MKIKLLSDLHTEFYPYKIEYSGEDILVLAGDIALKMQKVVEIVMEYFSIAPLGTKVIYITGNHEYYHHTVAEVERFWQNFEYENFYYLQNSYIDIEGIRFFGSTLWTDLNKGDPESIETCSNMINDYKLINKFTPKYSMLLHNNAVTKLRQVLDTSELPIVVITHHLPTFKSIDPMYKMSSCNHGFACTDMDDIMKSDKIILWCHGHTHQCLNYMDGSIQILCNPRGYITKSSFSDKYDVENKLFNENLIVDLLAKL